MIGNVRAGRVSPKDTARGVPYEQDRLHGSVNVIVRESERARGVAIGRRPHDGEARADVGGDLATGSIGKRRSLRPIADATGQGANAPQPRRSGANHNGGRSGRDHEFDEPKATATVVIRGPPKHARHLPASGATSVGCERAERTIEMLRLWVSARSVMSTESAGGP